MFSEFVAQRDSSGKTAVVWGMLLTLTFCGCGKSNAAWETVYPAKGKVTYKGKPVADAEIAFFPEESTVPDSVRPRAKSDQNGEFVVWTYETGDGAPAGNYRATVVHHEVTLSKDTLVTKPNDLPRKYSTRDSTDLQVTIGNGPTEIPPFELK